VLSLNRACDGSAEGPESKTKYKNKGELLETLEREIFHSVVKHDGGVKGEQNRLHPEIEEVAGVVKATALSNAKLQGKLS
jgi:hypothetical protein